MIRPRPCLLAVAILAAAAVAGAQETLDAAAIEQALAGATTRGTNAFGNPYTVRFLDDGSLAGVAGFSDEYVDDGSWWIDGDSLCRRWANWLEGGTDCFSVALVEGEIIWTDAATGAVVVEDYEPPQ